MDLSGQPHTPAALPPVKILFILKSHLNIILMSKPRSYKWSVSFRCIYYNSVRQTSYLLLINKAVFVIRRANCRLQFQYRLHSAVSTASPLKTPCYHGRSGCPAQRPTLHGSLQNVSLVTLLQFVISFQALNCPEKVEADRPPDKRSMPVHKTECLITILTRYTSIQFTYKDQKSTQYQRRC